MTEALLKAKTPEEMQAAIDDFFAPFEVEPGVFAEYDEKTGSWVYTDKDGDTYYIKK